MRSGAYLIFIALSLGIVVAVLWPKYYFGILFAAILFFIGMAGLWMYVPKSKKYIFIYGFFITTSFFAGAFRMYAAGFNSVQHSLDQFIGKKITLKGTIIAEPDVRDSDILLTVKAGAVNILLLAAPGPPYNYGDAITTEGKLVLPKNFPTNSGNVFDYVHYLAKDDIFYEMKMPKIKIVAHGRGNFLLEKLFALKKAFTSNADKVIPYPESALLGGILFGTKRTLGTALLSAFQTSGVIHMVVISGYNISIVGNAAAAILSALPRAIALSGGATSILLFVAMTGFSGASVRAAIMALIAIAGLSFRRNYDPLRALFISGSLMILWNPLTLLYDPSFELSFLATFSIIILPPLLEPYAQWLPKTLGLRDIFIATLSSQIILMPLLLYMDGAFSLFALPVNMLVLFPIPLTMLIGFLTGLVGCSGIYPSIPFAFVSFLLLSYELGTVVWFSKLPFASIQITFPLWAMSALYIFYGAIFLFIKKKTPQEVFSEK